MSTYQIFDKATGRKLGRRSYVSLTQAVLARQKLVTLAFGISQDCGQDAATRADIRREVTP